MVAAAALAALLFGLYGAVSADAFSPGYEPTYAAGAEGFLRTGIPQLMRDSPLYAAALGGTPTPPPGRVFAGPTTGWAGPVTAAPIVGTGLLMDKALGSASGKRKTTFLFLAAHMYAPLLIALTGMLVFLAGVMLFDRIRGALALALAYGLSTLAVPYTKIGMEPPLAFWTMLALTGAIAARRSSTIPRFALCGIAAGFAASTRMPVAPVLILPVLVYAAWPLLRARAGVQLAALVVPFVVLNVVSAGYDHARCGRLVCETEDLHRLHSVPYEGVFGLLFSPGKSMFLTSPILLLSVVGLAVAWRVARGEALLVGGLAVVAIGIVSWLPFWADELYGARYLLFLVAPAALLIGYALGWGPASLRESAQRLRYGAFAALVGLGIVVQLAAVVPQKADAPCGSVVLPLLGPERFDQNSCRFVPQLSDVVVNLRLGYAMVKDDLGGGDTVISYTPTGLPPGHELPTRKLRLDVGQPSLAVARPPYKRHITFFVAFLVLAAAGAAVLLPWLRRPVAVPRESSPAVS